MRSIRWVFGFLLLVAGFACAQATPSLDQIVDRLEKAQADNHAPLRPYTAVREFRILSGDHDENTDEDQRPWNGIASCAAGSIADRGRGNWRRNRADL